MHDPHGRVGERRQSTRASGDEEHVARVDAPGHADLGPGQRRRVPQGVAEQLADDQRDVTDGGLIDVGRDQV